MSRASAAGNSVVKAIEDICGLFRVPVLRMQSRTFIVPGVGGRERPMFMGEWTDMFGYKHRKGMADLLAMPCIETGDGFLVTVPLWIECKAGTSEMRKEQIAFKEFVEAAGAYHLEARDSADPVIEWFKTNKVEKRS